MEVAISEFKAKCIHLLKTTARDGGELVVTVRGKPLARVTGCHNVPARVLGGQAGVAGHDATDNLIHSDFTNDWES